ncbi:MAG: M28 family peptidase [Blastocatellia bacterium]|nr:M28 family peptidase [Blastocatellia bacterium]
MKPSSNLRSTGRALVALLLTLAFISSPALAWQSAATAPKSALTKTEREAASRLKVETLRETTTALASKEMEGRGTAQPGGDRAAKYLADRFAKLGLKPLGDSETYLQAIKFKSSQVLPESVIKAGEATLKHGEDFVAFPPYTYDKADVSGGLVFVCYGVISSDLKRDDLAGLDLKGKTVVVLNGGPPKGVDKDVWQKATGPQAILSKLIGKGPAAFVLTNIGNERQPYALIANYLSRRRVELANAPGPPFKIPPIILMSDEGAEKLFAGSGVTFAEAKEKAESGEFVSRDLSNHIEITLRLKREEGTSNNVVGLLEGSDAALKQEALVYTAHYDAYGIDLEGRIYPGAADNGLGTGMLLAVAEALSKSPSRPRRSVIFLAVTGEEYGLLGAEHWVRNPTWPIEKVAANINFDSAGTEVYGPVKNMLAYGAEHSELGTVWEGAVTAIGASIIPDPFPEEGVFYRSDHYAFVKKGVPAIMPMGGPGGDQEAFKARVKKWLVTDYHSVADTVRPEWHWDGARTVALVGLIAGMRVANADAMPKWMESSPFNRTRGTNQPPPPRQ